MPKIFISYRREDSKHAVGRLHAALSRHVRNPKRDIFIDIDNIPRGVDFVDHLDAQVAQCDIMLAVIGPGWLAAKDATTGKRRLDDPNDFVRIEVASALKRGIPVVPVVLDGTKIPGPEDLPDDLRLLARRNGERLEHESFTADVTRLIKNLPTSDARSATPASRVTKPAARGGSWIGPVVALAFVVLAGGAAWAWMANPGDWRGTGGAGAAVAPPVVGFPAALSPQSTVDEAAATAWGKLNANDPQALRQFIKDFSLSDQSVQARNSLSLADAKAWALASSTNTVSSYQVYQRNFPASAVPAGAHFQDAADRMTALSTTGKLSAAAGPTGSRISTPPPAAKPAEAKSPALVYADVAGALTANCNSCHTTGGVGPMSLTTCESVKGFAPMIRYVLQNGHGTGAERIDFSQDVKKLLIDWVEGGGKITSTSFACPNAR